MRPAILATTLLLAACTSSPTTPAPAQPGDPEPVVISTDAAQIPPCASLFRDGQQVTVTGGQLACTTTGGTPHYLALLACPGGKHLGSIAADTGAPEGWFLAPGPFHAVQGDVAADPGYGAAYDACR